MMLGLREVIIKRSVGQDVLWIGAFDVSRETFRNKIFPEYKANRQKTPPDLIPQFPLIRDASIAFGCEVAEFHGFEADDVIASYVKKAKFLGANVVIVSSDKDLMQLYGEGVEIFDPMKSKWITEEDVIEKFGVPPSKVVDVQALAGDPSDGIPGVPGIGTKTAAELIKRFGSLEILLSNAHLISQKKRRDAIMTSTKDILLAKQLVTLRGDVNVIIDEEKMRFDALLSGERIQRMVEFCKEQNLLKLQRRLEGIKPQFSKI
jgi:DNA polymerase-1